MKFGELIEHCIACIKQFNPVIKTIDSHADDFISAVSLSLLSLTISCLFSSKTHTRKYLLSKCSMDAPGIKTS